MAGLAAGIRPVHCGEQVRVVERHSRVGGLESLCSMAGRRLDVGQLPGQRYH
ncbi:MAG: hypothetical protein IBX67_07925 [Dehalococcoidia bacterium]|nr:hypothetical protein [Dehalococcoidia bacterium]